ncbi:hypothetical protein CFP56_026377 [Quercus suber]|uniref:Reverse transcriptase n=1 Tax=Quercus suber TaxID=58331 RepID=A0AAW0LZ36_QUESU
MARAVFDKARLTPPKTSLLDRELVVIEEDTATLFEELRVSSDSNNPRSFPYNVKQQCWNKAEKVRGRDPDRWRRDALGNLVFRKLYRDLKSPFQIQNSIQK